MTPRYAPVMPLAFAEQVYEHDLELLGDYHLLIASEVRKNVTSWRELLEGLRLHYGDLDVILDNGVIETGQSLDIEEVAYLATTIGANCIVLPDVVGDFYSTMDSSTRAFKWMRDNAPSLETLGVAQGEDPYRYQLCMKRLLELGVDRISLPKGYSERLADHPSRASIIRKYHRGNTWNRPLHVLGFTDDLLDDVRAAQSKGVTGIDSAMPVWLGMQGGRLRVPHYHDYGRRPNWDVFDNTITPAQMRDIVHNIDTFRRWLTMTDEELVLLESDPESLPSVPDAEVAADSPETPAEDEDSEDDDDDDDRDTADNDDWSPSRP